MIHLMVQYTVAPTDVARVKALVATFVKEIAASEATTTVYHAYHQPEKPGSFVHWMYFEDEAAQERHRNAEYTHRFVTQLYPLCEQEPAFSLLEAITY